MKVVIGSSFYPEALQFFSDWSDGVKSVTAHVKDVTIVASNDGVSCLSTFFDEYLPNIKVDIIDNHRKSIPEVRKAMITAVVVRNPDIAIFCDADDKMLPNALTVHSCSLRSADISVADLSVWDGCASVPLEPLFGSDLPTIVTTRNLECANYCGFSNTAARPSILKPLLSMDWPNVTAVDWWMYSRLADFGAKITGVRMPVALYRQHEKNTIGGSAVADTSDLKSRLLIVSEHFAQRPGFRAQQIAKLARNLSQSANFEQRISGFTKIQKGWYADVVTWIGENLEAS